MFKLEINVNGVIKHRHWRNKHTDDFLQFLPKFFTKEYGEVITKEDITGYLIDEAGAIILDGRNNQSLLNDIHYAEGKILVKRIQKALYKEGDKVKLEDYEVAGLDRDEKFKDSKDHKDKKTRTPKSAKEEVDDGEGNMIEVDMVTVEATDDLVMDLESLELELIGKPLTRWSYDENGKFIGNK